MKPTDAHGEKAPCVPADADPVALLDAYLDQAIQGGATDLHFEPFPDALAVRMRLDGLLHTVGQVPKSLSENILCRLMVLGGLLTYRTDIPQEGRIKPPEGAAVPPRWAGADVGLRLATFPTVEGTRAVVRIIRGNDASATLESLGYPAECLETLSGLTRRRSGLVLLTGPAGSGKTTTIYTFLQTITREQPGVSVISLEDPVEQRLETVTQIQIAPHGQLTYQRALRSLLRQDPQVLALGEIRDAETANICIEAALAGHLLISTVHSGTVAGAIVRLSEMGIPSYQLTSAIEAILAQRLVRRLCPACRREVAGEAGRFEAVGCDLCAGTGYHGRTVIAELGLMTGAFRVAVRSQADIAELERALTQDGMAGLQDQAGALVARGVTTIDEVSAVLGQSAAKLRAVWKDANMAEFKYRGLGPQDVAVEGQIEAADHDQANALLTEMQVRVTELAVLKPPEPVARPAIGRDDFVMLNEQLIAMINAGVPLEDGFRHLAQDLAKPRLRRLVNEIAEDLASGTPLEEAIRKRQHVFPTLYAQIIAVGMRTGRLAVVLAGLNRHLEFMGSLRRTVWEAVNYPLVVLFLATFVMWWASLVIAPGMSDIYLDFGTSLPVPTKLMLALSERLVWLFPTMLAGTVLIVIAIRSARGPRAGRIKERIFLSLPGFGTMLKNCLVARFTQGLALMVRTGIPLDESVVMAGEATGSPTVASDSARIREALGRGESVRQALQTARVLPRFLGQMLQVALERQQLQECLEELSQLYDQRAQTGLTSLRVVLLPVGVFMTGIVVGFYILSMFLPLVKLISSVSGGK